MAKANGFSLHAGVSCEGHQKDTRERLCRYIARPAVAVPCLSLSSTGKVLYTLKTPYRDGTTQVALDRGGHPPVDFIARIGQGELMRSIKRRCLGCIAAKRGKGVKPISNAEGRSAAERPAAMTWAQRLKRVFNIGIEVCSRCGGSVRVIARVEYEHITDRILSDVPQLPSQLYPASKHRIAGTGSCCCHQTARMPPPQT